MKRLLLSGLLAVAPSFPALACQVSLAEFDQIKIGMTPLEVADIIGCPGEIKASQNVGDENTKIVVWMGDAGTAGYVDVMFQSGVMVSKSHHGLQ